MAAAWSIVCSPGFRFGVKFNSKGDACKLCHAFGYRRIHASKYRQQFRTRVSLVANSALSNSRVTKPSSINLVLGVQTQRSLTCTVAKYSEKKSAATKQALEEKRIAKAKRKEAKRLERIERQKLKEQARQRDTILYTASTVPGEKKDVQCPLPPTYSPKYVEAAWYEWWEKEGFFNPDFREDSSSRENFVVCLPPPNVTGTLHLGHALGNSIQDAIVRWHRMKGKSVVWVPGSDHAGIATQVVVEKDLWKTQRKTRHDLGREKFLEQVWKWKEEKGDGIYDQMRKLGSSLDWSRECFTLDPKHSEAVAIAFIQLYNAVYIYRGTYLVNWSCALRSTISDIEVDDLEINRKTYLNVPGYEKSVPFGVLTSFAYPVEGTDEEIVVATTRPETMLGDTGIAFHPDDTRYSHLHGRHAVHPLTQRKIPIICDEFVDRDFGTGAVKLTPAHDNKDFDIGRKHRLKMLNIIDDSGCLVNVPEQFQGMKRLDARSAVLDALSNLGLLRGEQEHAMTLPVCSRSKDIVEPRLKEQWFLDCRELAKDAIKAVESGALELVPAHYERQWIEWLKRAQERPWCISRQLWWGHRIPAFQVLHKDQPITDMGRPVWIATDTEKMARKLVPHTVVEPPEEVTLVQDEDVLDTWFSSALLPFSIFGWPNETVDLSRFFPTDLLETGSDIIFFWVARMVMLSRALTGQLPFKKVLFHSVLRDAHGRKMSKSLGNIIDPMDVIHGISLQGLQEQLEKSNLDPKEVKKAKDGQKRDFPTGIPECGADALRFALCSFNFKSHFINVDVQQIRHSRHFCNKIWQTFKYISSHFEESFKPIPAAELSAHSCPTDRWILSRLSAVVQECNAGFSSYDLNLVTKCLHDFWWKDLCDVYLEYSKPVFQSQDAEKMLTVKSILHLCMDVGLRAFSPFMPFLTEELFQRLPHRTTDPASESICLAPYPQLEEYQWRNPALEADMDFVRQICGATLSARADYCLSKQKLDAVIATTSPENLRIIQEHSTVQKALSWLDSLTPATTFDPEKGWASVEVTAGCTVYINLQGAFGEKMIPGSEFPWLAKDAFGEKSQLALMEQRCAKLKADLGKLKAAPEGTEGDSEGCSQHHSVQQEKINHLQANLERVEKALETVKGLTS